MPARGVLTDSARRGSLAAQLLALWDEVAGLHPARRALAILHFTDPSATEEQVAELSVGEAEERMLALRRSAFGETFDALSRCPHCEELIELSFGSSDFPPTISRRSRSVTQRIDSRGCVIEFRAPTLSDLATVSAQLDAEAAEIALIELCVTSVTSGNGKAASARSLPRETIDEVGAALEKADPLSCTRVRLTCPACSHEWSSLFDVSAYLWMELESWAKGILGEVHLLAGAYGWSEADILSLSPRRRSEYLEMVLA